MNEFSPIFQVQDATIPFPKPVKQYTPVFVNDTNALYKMEIDVPQGQTMEWVLADPCRYTQLLPDPNAAQYARPYKSYVAILTQVGENNPTAIVVENTLGFDFIWNRSGVGLYDTITDAGSNLTVGSFPVQKTVCIISQTSIMTDYGIFATLEIAGEYQAVISTRSSDGDPSDDSLRNHMVEIRVYN